MGNIIFVAFYEFLLKIMLPIVKQTGYKLCLA